MSGYRRSYALDPTLCDRVFDLLTTVFYPALNEARHAAERFGATWESVSTPFVRFENDCLVSHVGLLTLPLVVRGRPITAGGVHGVATHPEARRRGYYRAIMEALFDYAAPLYETLALTTAHPEYFTPFGFRVVPESVFVRSVPVQRRPGRLRPVDPHGVHDRALVHRLLEARAPHSGLLAVGLDKAVFAFNETGTGQLAYSGALDLLVVSDRVGGTLRLLELIGPTIPSLERLLEEMGGEVSEVVTFFPPDRLGPGFVSRPHDLAGGVYSMDRGGDNTYLMVRGPFAAEGLPLMLSRSARC